MSSGCSPWPGAQEAKARAEAIAKSMGMSQRCKREVSSLYSDALFTSGAEASLGAGLAASASASIANSSVDTQNSLNESGCGTAVAQITDILNEEYNLMCTLNKNKTTTNVSGSVNASINVNTLPRPQPQMPVAPPGQVVPEIAWVLFGEAQKIYANAPLPGISMRGAIIKNMADATIEVSQSVNEVDESNIILTAIKQASAAAASKIERESGVGSSAPKLNQLLQTSVQNKSGSITTNIKDVLNATTITYDSNAGYNITSYDNINLDGITIDQRASARIKAGSITERSIKIGNEIASEILGDAKSETSLSEKYGGYEDLMAEIQKGLADRTGAGLPGGSGSGFLGMDSNILILVAAVVALYFFWNSFGTYIIIGLVIYLVAAYYFDWFPWDYIKPYLFMSQTEEELRHHKTKKNKLYSQNYNVSSVGFF